MTAQEYFERQSITDSTSAVNKLAHKYSRFDLCKFAESYHKAMQPTEKEIDKIIEPITGIKDGNSNQFIEELVRNGINWCKNFKRENGK